MVNDILWFVEIVILFKIGMPVLGWIMAGVMIVAALYSLSK